MIEKVLRHLRNWFVQDIRSGEWEIKEGSLELPFLLEGQYFRIVGSVLNDGVYQYPTTLQDEAFTGEVWCLAIPTALRDLITEIEEWEKKNGAISVGPYSSESFGGYTYTRATNKAGGSVTWETAFKDRLSTWRKI